MELVYPFATELGPVRLWCAVYVAAMLLGGALFGNTFYEHADPFEVYSTLVSRMSVWGARADASSWWSAARWPTSPTTPVAPGLVAVDLGAVRQHGVRLVQGLDALGEVHPGRLRRSDHGLTRLVTFTTLGLLTFVLVRGAGVHASARC